MRYVIIGAGAVGGTIGARLFERGHEVVLTARGAHYAALREGGLRFATPSGVVTLPIPVVSGPDELTLRADDVLIVAVKTQDAAAALDAWAGQPVTDGGATGDGATGDGATGDGATGDGATGDGATGDGATGDGATGDGAAGAGAAGGRVAAESLPVFCAQNGVAGERIALRRFRRVYGVCVWLPATHLDPGAIAAQGAPLTGLLHLGRYPAGADETARRVAADLTASAFLAPVSVNVMRWKYAKLLTNLNNAVEAICGSGAAQNGHAAGAELRRRARAEGAAVLAAAGFDYPSTAEQAAVRGDRVKVEPISGAPRGGGSSWQSLTRGTGSIEADYLNGEIALLGREHGVPTPVNDLLQRLANQFARDHRAPGSVTASELAAITAVLTAA
jgi:2-dehydropantoate 2-reductase